jgi:hypothetical protein
MKNNLMMDMNQGVHLAGTGWYVALLRKVQHGLETNKEGLLINNLREAVSFRAKMRLVVAMRLQAQHPPF